MRLKLLACEVFTREIGLCMAEEQHTVDVEFTAIDSHDSPDALRQSLQAAIDNAEASGREYDAILLCYGLCGNATVGLVAGSVPLVIPRAHDCCTILLGSKRLFRKHFGACPSQSFCSRGHLERSSDGHVNHSWMLSADKRRSLLANLYGEENADDLAKAMAGPDTGRLVYVNIKPTESRECIEMCRKTAADENREFVLLDGGLVLIRNLISGNWYPDDFLVVKPGGRIAGVYDWDRVMEAAE
ncbi:MAG TPA: DUF1638 domain-containing protein [Chitinivibrionales bacterium]|jgi:hypothetical protein|nr:DUF1638 domain-containing protein [Chitinivibrionales bacterium]